MAAKMTKPEIINQQVGWCPGCGHGIIQRLIAECCEELGLCEKTIQVVDIACAYWSIDTLNCDGIAGPHGRCAAVATAIKKVYPDSNVYVHAGDGCSYVIGLSETCYAAQRNVPITMIVVNNGIFGMTGGQMSLTTMEGQKTSTSVHGRDCSVTGYPLRFPEMVAREFPGAAYAARGTVTSPSKINQLKGYIKNGLQAQMNHEGYSVIEVLSPCPVNWGLTPVKAMERIESELVPYYPLGEFKKREVR